MSEALILSPEAPEKLVKWETMARPSGLLRYINSGVFFGRVRYKGKLIGPKSLETTDYKIACDRLPKYVAKWKKERDDEEAGVKAAARAPTLWSEAAAAFLHKSESMKALGSIQQGALDKHIATVAKIEFYWPSIITTPARAITEVEALDFFVEAKEGTKRFVERPRPAGVTRFQKGLFLGGADGPASLSYLLWTARTVVDRAIQLDIAKGLDEFENPFLVVPAVRVPPALPPLPSNSEFDQILDDILNDFAWPCMKDVHHRAWAGVNFMSMSGVRIGEVLGEYSGTYVGDDSHPGFLWEDIHDGIDEPYLDVVCEKKRKNENWRRRRQIPFYGGRDGLMSALVKELREKWYTGNPKAKVFEGVSTWYGFNYFLRQACLHLKLKDSEGHPLIMTQHDIRHIFATRCVEGWVTWKTLAAWLGHADGGILAANTYSHLRREHSSEMASRLGKKGSSTAPVAPATASASPAGITVNGRVYSQQEVEQLVARFQAMDAPAAQ